MSVEMGTSLGDRRFSAFGRYQTQRQTPPTLGDGALHGKATQQQFDAASSAALRATELPLHRRNEGLTANVSGSPICPDCPANRPKVDRFIYQACSASASAKLKGLVDRQLLHGHASSSSLGGRAPAALLFHRLVEGVGRCILSPNLAEPPRYNIV